MEYLFPDFHWVLFHSPEHFQQFNFISVLCVFFCIAGIINLWTNSNYSAKSPLPSTISYTLQQVSCALLISISFAKFIVANFYKETAFSPETIAYSSCLEIVPYVIAACVLRQNKQLGIRCSSILKVFWFLLITCIAFKNRTVFIKIYNEEFETLSSELCSHEVAEFFIILYLFISSLSRHPSSTAEQSFLDDSSYFSLLTFSWFNKYVYRSEKELLTFEDFRQPLYFKLDATHLWEKFHNIWKKPSEHKKEKVTTEDNYLPALKLYFTLMKSAWVYAFFSIVLELIFDVAIFIPPLVLDKFMNFLSEDAPISKGYFYCILLFLTNIIAKSISNLIMFFLNLYVNQIRTICFSAIYRKALKLSCSSRRQYTTGEMTNLMHTDVGIIVSFSHGFLDVFASPLKSCIALYMLWQYLGYSLLAGMSVIFLSMIMGYFINSKVSIIQKEKVKAKDSRMKFLNEILNGIKVLKLYAWEIPFMKKISNIREKEINLMWKLQLVLAGSVFVWEAGPLFVAVTSFVTYILVDKSHVLNAATIFVSINLLNTLQYTISDIPYLTRKVTQVRISLNRLSRFLHAEEFDTNAVEYNSVSGMAVSVQNGSFSWSETMESTLSGINFSIPEGSLVAVVGPVGSGKSSLISALLGEITKISGCVNMHGNVAYVPQEAWILNRTLKENILLNRDVDEKKYELAIDGCSLREDLKILPAGDKTEIGEKGINLSGGQKQRVSLARAIVHDADIYLLDDPLSSVDAHVGKHIFENVIGNTGQLKNKTRIFVTHNINFLSETDFIITMKSGKICEMGTYNELMESGDQFADFIKEHGQCKDGKDGNMEKNGEIGKENYETNENYTSPKSTKENTDEKLVKDESIVIGKVKGSIYKSYIKQLGIFYFFALIIGIAASTSCDVGMNVWVSDWSNDTVLADEKENDEQRKFRVIVYVALGLLRLLIKSISMICLAHGSIKAAKVYHNRMLFAIMRAPLSFFDTTPIGRITNRFGQDIGDIDSSISPAFDNLVSCVIYSSGTLILVGVNVPLLLPFLIPIGFVYYVLQKYYLNISRQLKRLSSNSHSPVLSHFSETINGASSINAYKIGDYFTKSADNKLNSSTMSSLYSVIAHRWLQFTVQILGSVIVLITSLLAVRSKDTLTAGTVGLTMIYAFEILQNLRWLVNSSTYLETSLIAVERIEEYSQIQSEAPWSIPESSPNLTWPEKGKLSFKDYSTRYRDNLELVIKHINLNINENEKVGVIGRTGAGKSSFALALFRIIEPAEGTVFIDDVDISKIGLHHLRSKLTIIPQDPTLFTGSLRMNLDPHEEYSDDEIWNSLKHAQLETFVSSLPEELNYEIAEGGSNLSVGQKQLICLARALLKQAKILVLDEATASVDMDTDRFIQKTIRSEFDNYTVITIAHRLNTIMDYDRIIVIDAGEVIETGNPLTLREDTNSYFYNIAKSYNHMN